MNETLTPPLRTTRGVAVHYFLDNHAQVRSLSAPLSQTPTPPHPTPPRRCTSVTATSCHLTAAPATGCQPAGRLAVQPVRDWTRFLFLCLSENSRTQTVGHCQWLSTTKADLSRHGVACPGVGVICLSLKFGVTRVCDCTYM